MAKSGHQQSRRLFFRQRYGNPENDIFVARIFVLQAPNNIIFKL
jgi:hypothetical protein